MSVDCCRVSFDVVHLAERCCWKIACIGVSLCAYVSVDCCRVSRISSCILGFVCEALLR